MREGDSEEPKPNCLKKSNGSCRSCRAFASKPASPCISYFRRFSSSESTCRRVYRARACRRAGRSPNLIRIGYRRKLLCGACVAVLVRMILQRHLAIRLFQLRRIRIPGHAKFLQSECCCTAQLRERNADLVVVARSKVHVSRAQVSDCWRARMRADSAQRVRRRKRGRYRALLCV